VAGGDNDRTLRGKKTGKGLANASCSCDKPEEIELRPMTDQAVYAILQSRACKAKVKAFWPHDLRRSWASDLLDPGVDSSVVQRFVGHANVTTTARYDRRGEHAKKKAAKSLHVPFVTAEPAH
jgi:integrase